MKRMFRGLLSPLLSLLLFLVGCTPKRGTEKVLFDFESDSELDQLQWKCHSLFTLSDMHATHGGWCLKMDLYPSSYPGVSIKLWTVDWHSFDSLCFDLFNPQPILLPLTVRIDDRPDYPDYSDRYNAGFSFTPGINHFVLPLAHLVTTGSRKSLNLKHICRFLIFMVNPAQKTTCYLDNVRLVANGI